MKLRAPAPIAKGKPKAVRVLTAFYGALSTSLKTVREGVVPYGSKVLVYLQQRVVLNDPKQGIDGGYRALNEAEVERIENLLEEMGTTLVAMAPIGVIERRHASSNGGFSNEFLFKQQEELLASVIKGETGNRAESSAEGDETTEDLPEKF